MPARSRFIQFSKGDFMQALDIDSQSLGGNGGMGLGGGGGYNPLLWLITLGFLGGRNGLIGGGGETAQAAGIASNSAKIDCLAQGQSFLNTQLIESGQDTRFQNLNDNLNNLAGIERDTQDTIFRQTTLLMQQNAAESAAMQRQLAECCCDLKAGQQEIKTDIAMQTNTLLSAIKDGNQRILDTLCESRIEGLQTQNNNLQRQLQTAEIAAACARGPGNSGSVSA